MVLKATGSLAEIAANWHLMADLRREKKRVSWRWLLRLLLMGLLLELVHRSEGHRRDFNVCLLGYYLRHEVRRLLRSVLLLLQGLLLG